MCVDTTSSSVLAFDGTRCARFVATIQETALRSVLWPKNVYSLVLGETRASGIPHPEAHKGFPDLYRRRDGAANFV